MYLLTNRGLTHVTNAAGVVTPGPKRRKPTAKQSEFLSQDMAGVTFKPIGDLRDRKGWATLQEQVSVNGHDIHRVNRRRKLIGLFQQQGFQTLSHGLRLRYFGRQTR
jgi:hypothetical protein